MLKTPNYRWILDVRWMILAITIFATGCNHRALLETALSSIRNLIPSNFILRSSKISDAPILGRFQLTYYWITSEESWTERTKKTKRNKWIYTKTCERLTKVNRFYARQLSLEGTGLLIDGRLINVSGPCKCAYSPCFFVVNNRHRWGVGVKYRPLSPFRSVAVDSSIVPIGAILYLSDLDGVRVPGRAPWGGFTHDGCVVADDRGGNIVGKQLDLFMAKRKYYKEVHGQHKFSWVVVKDGSKICDLNKDDRRVI